jgi:hypothetical protein
MIIVNFLYCNKDKPKADQHINHGENITGEEIFPANTRGKLTGSNTFQNLATTVAHLHLKKQRFISIFSNNHSRRS